MNFRKFFASEFCEKVFDGTHDSPKYVSNGYPLVTSKNINPSQITYWLAPQISKKDFDFINKRSKIKKNDILISMIGTVGQIAIIKETPSYAIKNIGVFRVNDEKKAKYLFFYMQSSLAQNNIKMLLSGSTQQFLSLEKLRTFPIFVPNDLYYLQHIVDSM